jgi:hypothetical protein
MLISVEQSGGYIPIYPFRVWVYSRLHETVIILAHIFVPGIYSIINIYAVSVTQSIYFCRLIQNISFLPQSLIRNKVRQANFLF